MQIWCYLSKYNTALIMQCNTFFANIILFLQIKHCLCKYNTTFLRNIIFLQIFANIILFRQNLEHIAWTRAGLPCLAQWHIPPHCRNLDKFHQLNCFIRLPPLLQLGTEEYPRTIKSMILHSWAMEKNFQIKVADLASPHTDLATKDSIIFG